jgi:hypothetical protein
VLPRFQSSLDLEAALAEPTIIPAEMPNSSIHGMRIGLRFHRSLISASRQLRAIPAPEVPARSDPAANPAAIGCRAPKAVIWPLSIEPTGSDLKRPFRFEAHAVPVRRAIRGNTVGLKAFSNYR